MTTTITLPMNNKFIINGNNIETIIGKEAHTIYFEAQKELRQVKKELMQKNIEINDNESNEMTLEFVKAIIRRELK